MTPTAILSNLAQASALRAEAFAELRSMLQRMARMDPSMRSALRDEHEAVLAEQVLDRVEAKILDRSPLPCIPNGDAKSWSYVRQMVRNAWFDALRHKRREREHLRELPDAHYDPAPPPEKPTAPPERLQHALERVFAEHLRGVEERYHADQRQAWTQLKHLYWSERTIDEVMAADEGIEPGSSESQVRQARNRLATNHKRVRRALAETALSLARLGRIDAVEAEAIAQYLLSMVRCQRSAK